MSSSPAQDDAAQLQQLVQRLTEAASDYDPTPGAAGYVKRTNVSQIAKEIVRLTMVPSDMSMYHSINVSLWRNMDP